MYVWIEFADVSCELLLNFNPIYPLIVGALMPSEEKIGFVQVTFYFGLFSVQVFNTDL
jgi:ribosome biogenesis protein BMS1